MLKVFITRTKIIMATIVFTFEDKTIHQPIQIENVTVDQSILDIAEDNDIHLNHNCGGVCACSTCHIYVTKGMDNIQEISDKEEDFIDRAVNPRINSRLGCQCVLQAGTGTIEITLPDQTQFLGE